MYPSQNALDLSNHSRFSVSCSAISASRNLAAQTSQPQPGETLGPSQPERASAIEPRALFYPCDRSVRRRVAACTPLAGVGGAWCTRVYREEVYRYRISRYHSCLPHRHPHLSCPTATRTLLPHAPRTLATCSTGTLATCSTALFFATRHCLATRELFGGRR